MAILSRRVKKPTDLSTTCETAHDDKTTADMATSYSIMIYKCIVKSQSFLKEPNHRKVIIALSAQLKKKFPSKAFS